MLPVFMRNVVGDIRSLILYDEDGRSHLHGVCVR